MSARIPEEVQAAMLYEIMNQVMRSRRDDEEEQDDNARFAPNFTSHARAKRGPRKRESPLLMAVLSSISLISVQFV
jgi:hypothetical protein